MRCTSALYNSQLLGDYPYPFKTSIVSNRHYSRNYRHRYSNFSRRFYKIQKVKICHIVCLEVDENAWEAKKMINEGAVIFIRFSCYGAYKTKNRKYGDSNSSKELRVISLLRRIPHGYRHISMGSVENCRLEHNGFRR